MPSGKQRHKTPRGAAEETVVSRSQILPSGRTLASIASDLARRASSEIRLSGSTRKGGLKVEVTSLLKTNAFKKRYSFLLAAPFRPKGETPCSPFLLSAVRVWDEALSNRNETCGAWRPKGNLMHSNESITSDVTTTATLHLNQAGAPSFTRTLREEVVQVLTVGTLSNTFYVSGKELAKEAIAVLTEAREKIPCFLARAIVYARNEGLRIALPILGLAILSGGRGKTAELFRKAFRKTIHTPDDARKFASLVRSGVAGGRKSLGGVTAQMLREWCSGLSEYHAVKYGSAKSKDITLRDILRMVHPKPISADMSERFGWLATGKRALGSDSSLNPKIRALEALKQETSDDERIRLVEEAGLPFEVVIPAAGSMTRGLWEALLVNAPYMNLLRNLVTFGKHGVFEKEENVRLAIEKLTHPVAVRKSKVLPFRFFLAHKEYVSSDNFDSRIADALRKALEMSFENMPSFGGRTVAIAPDVSGSMSGEFSEGKGRFIDIAGIFAGALLRKVEERAFLIPFDTSVQKICASPRDEIMVTAEKIASFMGGGTAIGAPIEHLLARKQKVDVFIGITDQEEWAYGDGHECGWSFLSLWRKYRREVNPAARAYLVTIAPYQDAVAPAGEKGIRFIYGWSDEVLRYIALDLEGGNTQVEAIERMSLETSQNAAV